MSNFSQCFWMEKLTCHSANHFPMLWSRVVGPDRTCRIRRKECGGDGATTRSVYSFSWLKKGGNPPPAFTDGIWLQNIGRMWRETSALLKEGASFIFGLGGSIVVTMMYFWFLTDQNVLASKWNMAVYIDRSLWYNFGCMIVKDLVQKSVI